MTFLKYFYSNVIFMTEILNHYSAQNRVALFVKNNCAYIEKIAYSMDKAIQFDERYLIDI